ncbi:MAG: tetratricopeptide repeat protein, partial [Planctomycetota bacterium]
MKQRGWLQFALIASIAFFGTIHAQELEEKYQKLSKEEALKLAKKADQNISTLYQQGKYEKAIEFGQISLKLREKHLPADHPDVANSLNNLALLLQAKGDYEGAEPLYRRALEIYEKKLGNDHPSVAGSLNNLAGLLQAKGEEKEGKQYFLKSFSSLTQHLKKTFPSLTERQQETFLNNTHIRFFLDSYLSALNHPSEQHEVYENLLVYRGISSRTMRNRNRATVDPKVAPLFEKLKQARTVYANLFMSPNPKLTLELQQKLLKQAQTEKEVVEQEVYQASEEYRNNDLLSNT